MGPATRPRRDDEARERLEQVGSRARPLVLARERSIELGGELRRLVPGGAVARGSVLRVAGVSGSVPERRSGATGATTVGFTLAAAVTEMGEWAAAVDLDGSLGALAAGEAGV